MTYTAYHPFGCAPNCYGTLTIEDSPDFSLNTWGWMVQDLTQLWFDRTYVGENRIVPSAGGRVGYPVEYDEHQFSMVFWVTGDFAPAGTPYADSTIGLETNIGLLNAGVFNPVTTGDGARLCTLTMPSGATKQAHVQFDPLKLAHPIDDLTLVEFVMTGTILEGLFA